MELVSLKLVTIISEALLEDSLLSVLRSLGATGWSIGHVRGEGSRGVHASDWEGENVKIDTIVESSIADAILDHLSQEFFPSYAVVAYVTDVQVVRGEKYTRG